MQIFANSANYPSVHVNFVETSKKDYPINVADLVFYIFVLCKYCVFDDNIIELGNSRPEFFVAFEQFFFVGLISHF